MKIQIHKRSILLASVLLVVGGLVLACSLWVRKEQRQYMMNWQLIDSLAQGEFERTLELVEAGADPNTRVIPLATPTWRDLLQQLFHRSTVPANNSPTALMVVCGDCWATISANSSLRTIPERRLDDPVLLQVTKAMLLHGANVNARDETGRTALTWASMKGLTDRMPLLLEQGALIDIQGYDGYTPLHNAAFFDKPGAVKMLLKYHANANLRAKDGDTPLNIALHRLKPSPEIVRLLKAAGATK